MSSRALRRLRQQAQDASSAEDDDAAVESIAETRTVPFNPFALLEADSDANGEDEDSDKHDNDDNDDNDDGANNKEAATEAPLMKPAQSKPKRARGRRRKVNHGESNDEDDDAALDRMLAEMAVHADSRAEATLQQQQHRDPRTLLAIDPRHLDPQNELARMFGRAIVAQNAAADGDGNRRRRRGQPRREAPRRSVLVGVLPPHWPPYTSFGLSMQHDGDGVFRLIHGPRFKEVHKQFLLAVHSLDPNSLAHLLQLDPYHADALLQFSRALEVSGQHDQARDCTKRALWACERAALATFHWRDPIRRQLPYVHYENRIVHLALLRQLQFAMRDATWRTALELAKCLLSLDPENDPLGMAHVIGPLAVRAREPQWLIDYVALLSDQPPDRVSPGMLFALALAHRDVGNEQRARETLAAAARAFPALARELCNAPLPGTLSPAEELDAFHARTTWRDPAVASWVSTAMPTWPSVVESSAPPDEAAPLNVWRHAVAMDVQPVLSRMPSDLRAAHTLAHDPVPPPHADDPYADFQREVLGTHSAGLAASTNPIAALLMSLLPSLGAVADPDHAQLAALHNATRDLPQHIRDEITAVIEAARAVAAAPTTNSQQEPGLSDEESGGEDASDN